MAWLMTFVILVVLVVIALVITSVFAAMAASDIFSSSLYNSNPKFQTAHYNLTVAAGLGFASVFTLILILAVAAWAGGFSTTEVSDATLTKPNPTKEDLALGYHALDENSKGSTTEVVTLFVLSLISILTFACGVLSVMGTISISENDKQDSKSGSAYTYGIIASCFGIGSVLILILSIISYAGVRSAKNAKLDKIKKFNTDSEKKLQVKQVPKKEVLGKVGAVTVHPTKDREYIALKKM